jgi:hypothetical protein
MWQLSKRLIAPDDQDGLYFGFSVALEGSFALITCLKENDGRGYLFGRNYGGLNNWGLVRSFKQPSVGSGNLQYPTNVGAQHVWNFWSDGGGSVGNGALLLHNSPYYNSTSMLSPSSSASPIFGASSAISGNTIAIGAPFADTDVTDSGAVSLISLQPMHRLSPAQFDETWMSSSASSQGDEYGADNILNVLLNVLT